MGSYSIFWTHCVSEFVEHSGETLIEGVQSEEEAEKAFFRTRTEMNPYKGRFVGYVIDKIVANAVSIPAALYCH